MSHVIKKIGELAELTEILVGDYNRSYYLNHKSFQDWKIEDSEEGNSIEFTCPQLIDGHNLERGGFYQVFSVRDRLNPIACFELTDIQYDYLLNEVYVWKCSGKSWRDIITRIIINLKESRISFKDLCKKILTQLNLNHYAFSLDDSFIEDDSTFINTYGRGYKARAYCSTVFEDLNNLGYKIWFDANLKMHAYNENTQTNIREINYDWDTRIHEKKITTTYANVPSGRYIVKASNIVSDNYFEETLESKGDFSQQFILTQKSAEPVRLFISFDSASDLSSNFETPLLAGSDQLDRGNLIINNVPNSNFLIQKRNYAKPLNGDGGIVSGTRFFTKQNTGIAGLLGLSYAPDDQLDKWIAGFYIENNQLKLIYNGEVFNTTIPALIPTIRTNITNIIGKNITVLDSAGLKIGETIYLEQDGQVVNYGVIQNISGNLITLQSDPLMQFMAGQTLLQQSTYLIKWAYYSGSLVFYGKRSIDTKFSILLERELYLNGELFLQLYANNGHGLGLDFFDLQENLEIFVSRNDINTGRRVLDIAFEESASQLASEVQVTINSDDNYELKFESPEPEDFYTAETILNSTSIKLLDITDLAIGNRLLIDGNERFISNINIDNKIIYWTTPLIGLNLNIPIIKNDIFPAKGQFLELKYRTRSEQIMSLCPSNCVAISSKVPHIIELSFENQIKYSEFREVAQRELEKLCYPQLNGTFTMIIESQKLNPLELTGILSDIPRVGEKIRIVAPKYKTDFDGMEGFITNVVLSSVGHENTFKADITVGEDRYKFSKWIYKLNQSSRSTTLIDDSIPDQDLMCSLKINIQNQIGMSLSNLPSYNFNNNLYTNMINEIRHYSFSIGMSLSNINKWNGINNLSANFINGLAN